MSAHILKSNSLRLIPESSWKDIFLSIVEDGSRNEDDAVARFLRDRDTIEVLSQAFQQPPSPTQQSRARFDERTAAINIAPTSNGRYDVSQIRDDALWLSKQTQTDEVSALRIVILEWQSRPMARLIAGAENEGNSRQSLPSPTPSLGNDGNRGKTARDQLKKGNGPKADTEMVRRKSLLLLFSYERQYVSEVLYLVIAAALYSDCYETIPGRHRRPQCLPSAIEDCGNEIVKAWQLDSETPRRHFIVAAVDFLESRIESLLQPAQWLPDDEAPEELEMLRSQTLITEMIHTMQTIFSVLDWFSEPPSANVFASWFRFMNKRNFLNELSTLFPEQLGDMVYVVHSFTAVISLAMMKLPDVLSALPSMDGLVTPGTGTEDTQPFFRDLDCIRKTTTCLQRAAELRTSTASLPMLAWSLIFGYVGEYALSSKEKRETRQAQQAIDRYETAQMGEVDGARPSSFSRRSSVSSEASQQQQTFFEDVNDAIEHVPGVNDPMLQLAQTSLDHLMVLDCMMALSVGLCADVSSDRYGELGLRIRQMFLQLLRGALNLVDYRDITVQCCLAILTGRDSYWDRLDRPPRYSELEPARAFLGDLLYFRSRIWQVALLRFPHETQPLLRMCQALCIPACDMHAKLEHDLQSAQTFTVLHDERAAPVNFDDDANDMIVTLRQQTDAIALQFPFLRQSLPMLHGTSSYGRNTRSLGNFVLPAGTRGRIISDGRPMIVAWNCLHSTFAYFGLILQLAFDQRSSPLVGDVSQVFEVATGIVGVLATFTSSDNTKEYRMEVGLREFIFEKTSDNLNGYDDVVSLVFELLESQLYRGTVALTEPNSSEFLANSMRFMHSVLLTAPHRVWPFLGRSGLLGMGGSESRLVSAVSSLELPNGQYEFLMSSLRLFEALVRDAVTHSSTRRAETRALTRLHPTGSSATSPGTSAGTIQTVILNFTKIFIDVLESSGSWRFEQVEERLDLNSRICRILDQILNMYYGIDDAADNTIRLVASLAPAAEYLMEAFLSKNSSNLTTKALLDLILDGLATPINTITVKKWLMWRSQTVQALVLCTRFMRLSRFLNRSHTHLKRLLFDNVQSLTKLYAAFPSYRLEIVQLLDSLVRGVGEDGEQPPSLLTSIGQADMRYFVDVLSHFDHPHNRPHFTLAIWRFLSVAVSHKQQWFAIYLLNAKTPRERLKEGTNVSDDRPAMFQIALAQLANARSVQREEFLGVLEFLASAIDYSPGAMDEFERKGNLEAALKVISTLKSPTASSQADAEQSPHLQIQAAALIVKIIAMLAHYCNEKYANKREGPAIFRSIYKSMDFLVQHGVSKPSYNASLHAQLKANVEERFPQCRLSNFKRTTLNPSMLGEDFFYDIGAMRLRLKKDPHWSAAYSRSISQEIRRANLNLSVVEAQVNLFYAWKLLVAELNEEVREKNFTHNYYLIIMQSCLQANLQGHLPERYFSSLAQSRAEIALLMAQRFARKSRNDEKVIRTLHLAWRVISERAADIGLALASDDAEYLRTMLRLLCLLLGASSTIILNRETWDKKKDESDVHLVLEILEKGVSHSFRSLSKALHDDPSQVDTSDFAFINALLRTCLHFPGLEQHPQALYGMFVDNGTLRVATTLLSWADRLAIGGDPVYGEVSTNFLVELSKVSILAESIMVEGILADMLTTRLLHTLRRPEGMGPFDEPARVHTIWLRGILPLLTNILSAVGAPAAAEISTFLSLFQSQLTRASSGFDLGAPSQQGKLVVGGVTLAMVSEAQSLALLAAVTGRFREAGASAGIVAAEVTPLAWDGAAVRLDLENLLQRRNTLRDRLVPLGEREQAWARANPTSAETNAESRYEEIVVNEMGVALSLLGNDDE